MPFIVAGGGTEPSGSASRMYSARVSASGCGSMLSGICSSVLSSISLLNTGEVCIPVRLAPRRVASIDSCMMVLRTGLQVHNLLTRQLGARGPNVPGSNRFARRASRVHTVAIVDRALGFFLQRHEVRSVRSQVDLTRQGLANELTLTLEGDRIRQSFADNFLWIATFVFLEQLTDQVQMSQLVVQHALP